MQTMLYPRLPLKGQAWPRMPGRRSPLAGATSRTGDWHYAGSTGRRFTWLAVFISAGLHIFLLWGGSKRLAARPASVVQTERLIQLVMPPIEEDEEKPVEELDQADESPAVEVPRLMDLPSAVSLNSFVQPLEMNAALQTTLDASKLTAIPVKIAPAGSRPGTGMKNLFDISQLDRVPEPIAQPEPIFPSNLRNEVDRAEVVVEFIVDTHGQTRDVSAVSSTHAGFERAAIDGVIRWRFRAGMKDGRKVNTRVRIPIKFLITQD